MAIKRTHAPTLADVAREARVSLMTASRVLNGSSKVREEKVIKVQAAIARLGYRPNELARSLMTRRSSAIGMVVANLFNPFIVSVIKEVQQLARSKGYVVIVTSSGGDPNVERFEIEDLVRRQIDGIVIAPADSRRDTLSSFLPAKLPVVTIDNQIRGADFDSVSITNRPSAREATQHMLGHGFRRIVGIGTRPDMYTSKERVAGFREAMSQSGFAPVVSLVKHESLLTPQWIGETLRRHSADAVFSLNWVSTLHVLRALRELGLKIGTDMPVLCFDDFDLGDVLAPRLSVVQQPSELLGRESAALLFERLTGSASEHPRRVVLPARLVIRESCGCRQ